MGTEHLHESRPEPEDEFDEDLLEQMEFDELKAERGPLIPISRVLELTGISLADLKEAAFAGVFPAAAARCSQTPVPLLPEILWEPHWLERDVVDALPVTKAWLAARASAGIDKQ